MIIGYSAQQKLIPRAFAVDELFDDVTRALAICRVASAKAYAPVPTIMA